MPSEHPTRKGSIFITAGQRPAEKPSLLFSLPDKAEVLLRHVSAKLV
ncbi:MAG: hypothetical protein LBO71_10150 [Prevotellaceae bacterium]|nr:hypothetical protein [Prevotellaceae bacterium]